MNLRPSGYEPDELPGCSTPRQFRRPQAPAPASAGLAVLAACGRCGRPFGLAKPGGFGGMRLGPKETKKPPLGLTGSGFFNIMNGFFRAHAGCNAWRRPTLPTLERQYHWRSQVSRPSSRWDRVGHWRYGHQAMKPACHGFNRCILVVMIRRIRLYRPPSASPAGLSLMVGFNKREQSY